MNTFVFQRYREIHYLHNATVNYFVKLDCLNRNNDAFPFTSCVCICAHIPGEVKVDSMVTTG